MLSLPGPIAGIDGICVFSCIAAKKHEKTKAAE
jgi:hypothetical protein